MTTVDNFDFRRHFKHAVFVLAGHGDGCAAWLVLGWDGFVKQVAENCINCMDPSEKELDEAETMLTDLEQWQWSNEKVSQPYHWSFDGEAETLQVYRVNTDAASTQCALMATV